jgi:drug/metabolite transporter (DMT)-like permease
MDLLYAWIASIVSGIEPLVIKATSRHLIKNSWLFNIFWVAFGIPLVAVFAISRGAGLPVNWLLTITLSFVHALFYIFYTISIYRMDVSTLAPLFSIRTIFAVILGVIFLHEHLSVLGVVLIAAIILASPLASYDERLKIKAFWQKSTILAILAMFVLALAGYLTNRSVAVNGFATTLLWQNIGVLCFLLPTGLLARSDFKQVNKRRLLPFIFLGVTEFLYTLTATRAYAHNLALSSAIVSLPLSMVFAAALSGKYGEVLERHSRRVYALRFGAAAIMVGSAIWLSLL